MHLATHGLLLLASALPIGSLAQCTGTIVSRFDNDFELTNGGLVESGGLDWEWGVIPTQLTDTADCSTLAEDPPGAYSGTKGWGTVLNGCYNALGAESDVALTVDLSDPGYTSAGLEWQQWFDVFVPYDYMTVRANGVTIYFNDATQNSVGWEFTEADLDAYLGDASVELSFSFFATAVVNYAGWYLDDVHVWACSQDVAIDESHAPELHLSPNPAQEQTVITLPATVGTASLELHNAQGALVHTMTVTGGRNVIERGALPTGVYAVTVRGQEGAPLLGRLVFQ